MKNQYMTQKKKNLSKTLINFMKISEKKFFEMKNRYEKKRKMFRKYS